MKRSDLHPYQERAAKFIRDKQNCALFVEMGLGKSISALTAYADMLDNFEARKALVIGPLRVVRKVWTDEIKTWDHVSHLTAAKILGTQKQRLEALNTDADIHLINQENVVWLSEQFVQGKKQIRKWPWDLVILDESQGFRNQSSQRFKALRRLRRLFPTCVELTGTPSPNGLGNLWSQIMLLDGGQRLGLTERAFRDRWFNADMGDGYVSWTIKPGAAEQIHSSIGDIVLSLRVEDYFELPPVLFNPVKVTLSPEALKTYKKFKRSYLAEAGGKIITAVNAGALNGKLMQLANGSIYTDDKGNFEVFHDEKLTALTEVLDGISGPVMIGYSFRADAARIAATLTKFCGKEKTWGFAEGDADLERFAKGEMDYLVLHPASAGHGLNDMHKSGSTNIVWFGLTNNLEYYQQLNARLTGGIRRIGKSIVVHHIITEDTIDMGMVDLLKSKATVQEDLSKALVKHLHS